MQSTFHYFARIFRYVFVGLTLSALSGCIATTQFETADSPPLAPEVGFVKEWVQRDTPNPDMVKKFGDFYGKKCNDIGVSACSGVVTKAAVDVCVYETYHQDFANQFTNMGLTGVLIASGAATGIAALVHASGAAIANVGAATAAATTIVGATQKALPATAQPTVTNLQQTAASYIAISAPSYRMPSLKLQNGDDDKPLTYFCDDPLPAAGGTSSASTAPGCFVQWRVVRSDGSSATGDKNYPTGLIQKSTGQSSWEEGDYRSLYDAVLSACPAGVL